MYLGGVADFNQPGLTVKENFKGCVDNVQFNLHGLLDSARNKHPRIGFFGAVSFACLVSNLVMIHSHQVFLRYNIFLIFYFILYIFAYD